MCIREESGTTRVLKSVLGTIGSQGIEECVRDS